jgi:putative endopeptidase
MKSLFLVRCAVLVLAAATPAAAEDVAPVDPAAVATPHFGAWGYDQSAEDPTIAPGADFYGYANGKWLAREQIPADRVRFGNFDTLSENRTRLIIESAAAGQSNDPDAVKIGDAYRAFMDEARVQALDAKPLAGDLAAIRAEKTRLQIARLMGAAPSSFQSALFDVGVEADEKSPTRYAVYMDTAGLGLPDRDYYLEPQFAAKKAAYQAYVTQMLTAIGWPDAARKAADIVAFETQVAKVSWTLAEHRDRDKTYNPMTVAALQRYAPGFAFKPFLAAAGLGSVDRVILNANTAFPKLAALYAKTPVATLKAWQAFHLVDSAAPYLSDRFVNARFEFRNKTLAGQPQIRPRWKRGVGFVEGSLGESVGRLYVARYFTPEAKAQVETLVGALKTALRARIENLTWMEPQTKAKALEKLSKFTVKIGYPAKWRDYSALTIRADDL